MLRIKTRRFSLRVIVHTAGPKTRRRCPRPIAAATLYRRLERVLARPEARAAIARSTIGGYNSTWKPRRSHLCQVSTLTPLSLSTRPVKPRTLTAHSRRTGYPTSSRVLRSSRAQIKIKNCSSNSITNSSSSHWRESRHRSLSTTIPSNIISSRIITSSSTINSINSISRIISMRTRLTIISNIIIRSSISNTIRSSSIIRNRITIITRRW